MDLAAASSNRLKLHTASKNFISINFLKSNFCLLKSCFVLRLQVAHVLILVSCYRYPVAIFLLALGRVCVQEGKGNQNTAVATFVGKRRAVDRASIKSQKIESHTHKHSHTERMTRPKEFFFSFCK